MQELLEQARRGVGEVEGVELVVRPALACGAAEVLEADGYLLGTPANIGYMSGALKHFFDQIYYPCLDATIGRPYGVYVHGGNDTGGAVRSIEQIVGGLRWAAVRPALTVVGPLTKQVREDCWELGGLVAASVAGLV
ncbi:MAG TPA: NAD(P)H-dependent oxidoreductase [Frankiaceae bacterium]|jgi:NAD(P)H-dependent FMN reductase|nr:NAD(P)H-dependent oxidoreductase [Frankiaceae bacterium]